MSIENARGSPSAVRTPSYALYAFCRLSDDAVDGPGARQRYGADVAFPLSDHADFQGLVAYALATGRLHEHVPGVVGTLMTNMAVEVALKAKGVPLVVAVVAGNVQDAEQAAVLHHRVAVVYVAAAVLALAVVGDDEHAVIKSLTETWRGVSRVAVVGNNVCGGDMAVLKGIMKVMLDAERAARGSVFDHDFIRLQPGERIIPEDALDRYKDMRVAVERQPTYAA